MANPGGHPATLRHDSEAQAARRVVHRAYSPRLLAPRARELADALLALPHVQPIDQLAAEEIGALVARIDAVDAALDARQVGTKGTATLMICGCASAAGWSAGWPPSVPRPPHAPTGRHGLHRAAWPTRSGAAVPSARATVPDQETRVLLESIAYGDDPKVTPADRLRALEQLQRLQPDTELRQLVAQLSPQEVAHEWDAYCGADVVQDALNNEEAYPHLYAAIRKAVQAEAVAVARQLADADRLEAEVAAAAERRAEQIAQEGGLRLVRPPDDAAAEPEPADHLTEARAGRERPRETPTEPPPGLTWDDVQWPWHHGRRGY